MSLPMFSISYSFPYICVFFLLMAFALPIRSGGFSTTNERIVQYSGAFLLLFVFLGLRGFIFSDWTNYYLFFESAPTLYDGMVEVGNYLQSGIYSGWEDGFIIYSIIIKTIWNNYFFWQAISYLIDFCLLFWLFSTYVPHRIILCFVFTFVFGLLIQVNLMRNIKAILFFVVSLRFIESRKLLPYILLNLLGCFFHISAIIYLPLYFIISRRFSRNFLILLFIIGNIIYLAQIHWCLPVLDFIASVLNNRLSDLIKVYTSSSRWSVSYGITIGYLERTATFILMMLYRKKICVSKSGIILFNCLMIYLFSYLYLSEMRILTDRIPVLFVFSYWFLYPQLYEILSKSKKSLFLFLFVIYSVLKFLSGNKDVLSNYDNALNLQWNHEQRSKIFRTYSEVTTF